MPRIFDPEVSYAFLFLGGLGIAVTVYLAVLATAEYFGWRAFRGPCKPLLVELRQKDAEALLDVCKTNKALLEEARRPRRKARKYHLPSSKSVARRRGNHPKV